MSGGRIQFVEGGQRGRYIQRILAVRKLTGASLKEAHAIVNARMPFDCDIAKARVMLADYGIKFDVARDEPAPSITRDGIIAAVVTMTGASVTQARAEVAAAIARLSEAALYPMPEAAAHDAATGELAVQLRNGRSVHVALDGVTR